VTDSWRLALGTFTRIPVRAPASLDAPGRAIALAPLIAVLMTAPFGVLGQWVDVNRAIVAVIVVAALTWLTRALHLDGLADTADALGSARPAAEALAIARQSDIGPFGVIALVFALLGQVIALAAVTNHFAAALITAALISRIALVVSCTPAFPAARPDGLGALVAGSIKPVLAISEVLVAFILIGAYAWWADVPLLLLAATIGLLSGVAMSISARRRLGGVTGDTMGATIEVAFTTAVIAAAILLG
jgi:adenosylcobinamide-GDP ribazoletransferase